MDIESISLKGRMYVFSRNENIGEIESLDIEVGGRYDGKIIDLIQQTAVTFLRVICKDGNDDVAYTFKNANAYDDQFGSPVRKE